MDKILLAIQELDDLVVANTKPPSTAVLRNKLSFIREQLEAHQVTEAQTAAERLNIHNENASLKSLLADANKHIAANENKVPGIAFGGAKPVDLTTD